MASITKQQSLLFGEAAISFDSDVNASSIKPGSHLKEADHFFIKDGLGKGTMDRTYLYAFGE
jgi:hypothetical protein